MKKSKRPPCKINLARLVGYLEKIVFLHLILDTKYGNMPIPPTVEEIACGIAKRDKVRIAPTGTYALDALGLSR